MREPLTPADCDLRDFPFMPLDVVRLRDSDLAATATPEACWAAVLLWCASWHQVPAGSIPDDDRVLSNLAGYGRVVKEWQRVRDEALRGWVKCSDGRLYHPVVAAKALEAWNSKLEQRWKTECARIKKHADRHHINLPRPTLQQWIDAGCPAGQRLPVPNDVTDCPEGQTANVPGDKVDCPNHVSRETPSKGQGEGKGQRHIEPDGSIPPYPPGLDIEVWERWVAYRREVKKPIKPASMDAAMKALAAYGNHQADVVEQSVANGWQGLFPLKSRGAEAAAPINRQEAIEQRNRAVGDAWLRQQEALDAAQ